MCIIDLNNLNIGAHSIMIKWFELINKKKYSVVTAWLVWYPI